MQGGGLVSAHLAAPAGLVEQPEELGRFKAVFPGPVAKPLVGRRAVFARDARSGLRHERAPARTRHRVSPSAALVALVRVAECPGAAWPGGFEELRPADPTHSAVHMTLLRSAPPTSGGRMVDATRTISASSVTSGAVWSSTRSVCRARRMP